MKAYIVIIAALIAACAVFGAYTNDLDSGGQYIKKSAQALLVLNIDNTSGVYDTAQVSFDATVITSNDTTVIAMSEKRARQYPLLQLLGYETNLWTNIVNLLFYQVTP